MGWLDFSELGVCLQLEELMLDLRFGRDADADDEQDREPLDGDYTFQ